MTVVFTADQIQQAEQASIVQFCERHGIELLKDSSSSYRVKDHTSLVINDKLNYYYWNSQQRGGNVLSFAKDVLNLSFPEAMSDILASDLQPVVVKKEEPRQPFQYPYKNKENKEQAYHYLVNERKIAPAIVTLLMNKGFIQQVSVYDKQLKQSYDSVAFVWSKNSRVVGTTTQVLDLDEYKSKGGDRGKKIAWNPEKNFGFNVSIGEPKNIYLFEAPIDLLSYWSLHPELNDCFLGDLEGLKEETVKKFLDYVVVGKGAKNIETVYLGVDNDHAASRFCEKFMHFEKFQRLVPYDNVVPTSYHSVYQEVLQQNNSQVPIAFISAVHKAMTSFTPEDEFKKIHPKEFVKYFAEVSEDKKIVPLPLAEGVELLIKDYEAFQPKTVDEIKKMLQHQTNYSDDIVKEFAFKVNEYLLLYHKEELVVMDSFAKDWNDVLKSKAKQPVRNRLREPVHYQDKENTLLSVRYKEDSQKYEATLSKKEKSTPFFEADSPEEAAFLAKQYGFFAVDKEDQRKYFGKEQTKGTKIKQHEPLKQLAR